MPLSKPLRDALKGQVDLDWRKVTKARLLRFGDRVALSYVQLEPITKNLNRDPRLSNVGICLTDKGMTLVLQGPSDTLHPVHIPKEQLTQNYIKQFVQQMIGKIQVVGLDPTVPPSMRDIRTYLIRRLRNTQAEGAIVFRSLKRVSLGDRYLNRPVWDKQRPKLWQRKLLSQWAGYSVIMDLTGKPLLAKEESGGLVTGPLDKSVNPFIRANDAIQSVMAKLDLSPSATFLRSSDRQRVQRAFHRHSQRTIKATATKRTGT